MITRITRLRNFGIFHDFRWNQDIPEFKKFNLIYGWNRSGKTTLSRVFSACGKKSTQFRQYPKGGEFTVKTDVSGEITSTNLELCNLPIRVFNEDFVGENISFDPSDTCNPIVYIGEEDVESKKKLDSLRNTKKDLEKAFESARKEKKANQHIEDRFRISLAQTISASLTDKNVHDRYFAYDKRKVEDRIDSIGVENFKKLSDEVFSNYELIIRGESRQRQNKLQRFDAKLLLDDPSISSFDDVYLAVSQLLEKEVISETISRLQDDPELQSWVETGFYLHKTKQENEKCLFCRAPLDKNLLDSLSRHFSKDWKELQTAIEALIPRLESLRLDQIPDSNTELYPDLLPSYQDCSQKINQVAIKINTWIDGTIEKLRVKLKNPLSQINSFGAPAAYDSLYNKNIDELNQLIQQHNTRADDHNEEVRIAKQNLEDHYIAIAIKEQEYEKTKQALLNSSRKESTARDSLARKSQEIAGLEQETSNIGRALQKINKYLDEFFGRNEIHLDLADGKKGYIIKRDGQPAHNLSEGERTAIAFSYFIVKVQERAFNINEAIIFIDDPVSSFDSNFIYHCFSVLRNHFENAGQLFVSTHNFELFNLVKEWFRRKRKDGVCAFHMVENIITDGRRSACLNCLEKTLMNYKSEYHFLFARLNSFLDTSSPAYSDMYVVGNIARRFLEIFAGFKIPTTGDLYSKIMQLETKTVSASEKGKVYKLVQEFSHGSDPTSAIEHKDKKEIQEAVQVILKMVKESDELHYEFLQRSLRHR